MLFLALCHAAFLSESLVGGKVLTQIDALLAYEPWASVAPPGFRPSNELLLDQSIAMLPWLHFASERVAAGELPLWNPHDFAGQPLVAVPPAGLFWPPNWIYLLHPTWTFHAWHAWARLLLAGSTALLFLRALGLSRAAALFGATAFSLCGFNVVWLNHPHTNASPLLPLCLWLVERAARRPSLRLAAGLAPVVALLLACGHPQTGLHVLLATGAWALLRALVPVGGAKVAPRALGHLALGAGLGLGLALPHLLPLGEYLAASQGQRVSAELDLVAPVDALDGLSFAAAPDRFGHPQRGDYTGPAGPNMNYMELAGVFAGRAALALALVGLWSARRDRRALLLGGLGLAAALVAYQVQPFYGAMRALPVVNNTKLLRLVLVVAFAVSALGALGLDALLARVRSARLATAAGWTACAVAALELGVWGYGYNPAVERDSPTFLPATPVTDFLARDESVFRVLGADNSILLPNANLFYGVDMLTGYDATEYRALVELVSLLSSDPRARIFLKEARWFDKALPLAGLLNVKYVLSTTALPPPLRLVLDGRVKVYENPDVLPRAFAARDVVAVPDPAERLARLGAPDLDPRVALVDELPPSHAPAEPGAAPPGTVELASYAPRRVELAVDFAREGLAVLADVWDPGWVARVDGAEREVVRVDHALRGVWVRPGEQRVVLTHEPRSFRNGLVGLGVAATLCAGILALGGRDRARRAPAPPSEPWTTT